ncbi:hypothetical protein [Mesorhizobium onobrychidis]|uniref:Uncharacterized protein n=1 Tax=Mesorhizobium onobrychidis TaxID=2775404 RepID=A0ABY5RAI1_9HYPH|nr:hypothetical protein [Mesorhizobium onobrychidis]UVC19272.1 hypothetical protein IHQ72_28305 [Mesorhizobium onobrychidis]
MSTINPDYFSKAKVILQEASTAIPSSRSLRSYGANSRKADMFPAGTIAASSNRGGNQDKKDKPQQSSQAAGKDPNRGKDNPNSN